MQPVQGKPVTDFTLPASQERKSIEIQEISFKSLGGGGSAKVAKGTFSLEERVAALDKYRADLEKAKSCKGRLKRAAIILVVAAAVAGLVAAIVLFGFGPGIMVAVPLNSDILYPIVVPIIFILYMAVGYEITRANKVKVCKEEVDRLAKFIVDNKDEIDRWLDERRAEIEEKKNELSNSEELSDSEDSQTLNQQAQLQADRIYLDELKENLQKSYEQALKLRGTTETA